MLQAIKYNNKNLNILDQLLLPNESKYIPVKNVNDGWNVIKNMQVRGAPAIAIVGALSLAVEIHQIDYSSKEDLYNDIDKKMNYLVTARPTAINIKIASEELINLANRLKNDSCSLKQMKEEILENIESMLEKDVSDNKLIGEYGCTEIVHKYPEEKKLRFLTHCNTGSLATAGYGTALGVIRSIYLANKLEHVFCTETRPYMQGSRLTAYELVHDKLPATLICDNMVATLMQNKKLHAVIVGADRVVANGDTANKIGTYQIAVLAKYHNVPFYVASPWTSIDMKLQSGDDIVIEQRSQKEMTHFGEQRIAAPGINCWNPAFDITPASLITAIITEKGCFKPNDLNKINI